MTTTRTTPAPESYDHQPWCVLAPEEHAEWNCMSGAYYLELSQHHDMDARGVSRVEGSMNLYRLDSGLTLVGIEAPAGLVRLTTAEARQFHAALGDLLAQLPTQAG